MLFNFKKNNYKINEPMNYAKYIKELDIKTIDGLNESEYNENDNGVNNKLNNIKNNGGNVSVADLYKKTQLWDFQENL